MLKRYSSFSEVTEIRGESCGYPVSQSLKPLKTDEYQDIDSLEEIEFTDLAEEVSDFSEEFQDIDCLVERSFS